MFVAIWTSRTEMRTLTRTQSFALVSSCRCLFGRQPSSVGDRSGRLVCDLMSQGFLGSFAEFDPHQLFYNLLVLDEID